MKQVVGTETCLLIYSELQNSDDSRQQRGVAATMYVAEVATRRCALLAVYDRPCVGG